VSELRGRDRRYLRGLGHGLEPTAFVGKEGVGPSVVASIGEAFAHHELIKVRLERGCPVERKEAGRQLAALTQSELVQVLGRTVLLYRRDPEQPRIQLPN